MFKGRMSLLYMNCMKFLTNHMLHVGEKNDRLFQMKNRFHVHTF
jgi:hypothetical protein